MILYSHLSFLFIFLLYLLFLLNVVIYVCYAIHSGKASYLKGTASSNISKKGGFEIYHKNGWLTKRRNPVKKAGMPHIFFTFLSTSC